MASAKRLLTLLCGIVLITASAALAQQRGTIQGTVTDESGAVIPGANVSATNSAGQAKALTTDQNGAYTFTGLTPGQYTVRVNTMGFAKFEKAVSVDPGRTIQVDAQMRIAIEAQKVDVQADTNTQVSVDPSNNASAIVLKGDDLAALSDDPDDLASDLQALAGPAAGPNGGQIFVDGFSGAQLPPKESIREIRINSNPFASEYDKLGYGRIEILTKPGTDKFHGGLNFMDSDALFNSRNPFATTKPDFSSRQYSGNIGGPLSKKASFFFNAERRDINDNAIIVAQAIDPTTFGLLPLNEAIVTPNHRTSISPRIDYQLSPNNTLVARYHYIDSAYQNQGIGQFSLPETGYNSASRSHEAQITETSVIGTKMVNETRFEYERSTNSQSPNTASQSFLSGLFPNPGPYGLPTVNVSGAFVGGGANVGNGRSSENHYELTNTTSIAQGTHSLKFGGRFRDASIDNISPANFAGTYLFGGGIGPVLGADNQPVIDPATNQVETMQINALERYRRTLLFSSQGLTMDQIRALGGGPTQFSITGGNPGVSLNQFDMGLFAQDDWRVKSNLTLSLGLRYEWQTNIHDWRDFGPRVSFAWAPGAKGGKNGKTVIRGGSGIFYDRFDDSYYMQSLRFNGITEDRYTVPLPSFFTTVPPLSTIGNTQFGQTITSIDKNIRAPYIIQSAIGIERQLPKNTTISVNFTNSRGVHLLRMRNITAPYQASPIPPQVAPNSGQQYIAPPTGNTIYQYESTGILNQNQLMVNMNSRMNSKVTIFTWYVLNHARSDTDGAGTFPADQYYLGNEYGRSSYDVRHRFLFGGSMVAPFGLRFSPFITAHSGAPFNIVIGRDLNGDLQFTERPAFAVDPKAAGVVSTAWGVFDPNPKPGETIIPRNYGQGPAFFSVNLRVSRTWGFGEPSSGPAGGGGFGGPGGGHGGGGMMRGPGGFGGGRGGMFGETTNHKYNITLSVSARNLFNNVNYGQPVGDLSSPLFGQSTSIAGGWGPGGGMADNRRVDLMLRFTF